MQGRTQVLVVFGGVAIAAASLRTGALSSTIWLLGALICAASLFVRVVRDRRRVPVPWRLVVAGFALRLAADLAWGVEHTVRPGGLPFPAYSDTGYLASYALLTVGLLGAAGVRARGALLDAAIIVTGLAVIDWTLLLHPYLHSQPAGSSAAVGMGLVYPACQLVVFAAGVQVLFTTGARNRANLLLLLALGLFLASNTLFLVHEAYAHTPSMTLVDQGLWLASYLALGLAGRHRHTIGVQPDAAPVAARPDTLSGLRVLLFGVATLVAPTFTVIRLAQAHGPLAPGEWRHLAVASVLAGLMAVLLVTRLGGLARLAQRRSAELDAHGRDLAVALAERDRTLAERTALEHQLRHGALHDPVTGLANRGLLTQRMEWALTRPATEARHALLVLDLDRFTDVNDAFGHGFGDDILVAVAHRLQGLVAPADTVARLGGDEFAVFAEDTDEDAAAGLAELVRAELKAPLRVGGRVVHLGASVGLVGLHGCDPREALADAELALRAAKRAGRDRVTRYRPELRTARETFTRISAGLRHAVDRGELALHYQPVVELPNARIVAVEALLRWTPADGAPVSPLEFIPVAEETGLIVPIGAWVLEHACRAGRDWHERHGISLTVNVSVRQLAEPGYVDEVLHTLARTGLPADALVLEITESVFAGDAAPLTGALERLRAEGIRIAIDDFGTGYSALSYLTQLPVDILKIDRSFVPTDTAAAGEDHAFTRAVLQLGSSRRLPAIAEGIETAEQAELLHALGCTLAQGYHFARPGPAEQVEAALQRLNPAVTV